MADLLARQNPHPRDARVRFDEAAHKYYIDGMRYPSSVSGLIGDFYDHFDGPRIVENGYRDWKADKNGKYSQLINYLTNIIGFDDEQSKAEILKNWSVTGASASAAGTKTHANIEYTLNNLAADTSSKEFKQYEAWRSTRPGWTPYRTEWSVFSEPELICGQIDSLWKDEDGNMIMVDWKRVLELKTDGFKGRTMKAPFEHLPDTNLGHYAVQQSAYAWMLENKYGIVVKDMYLLQVHPTINTFNEVRLHHMRDKMDIVMGKRRERVARGELAVTAPVSVEASLKRPRDEVACERARKLIAFHQSQIDSLSASL